MSLLLDQYQTTLWCFEGWWIFFITTKLIKADEKEWYNMHKSITDHTWIQQFSILHLSWFHPSCHWIVITLLSHKILMLLPFFHLLSSSLRWTASSMTCPYLFSFLSFMTDVKCFWGSLAAVVLELCGGIFSGSLAPLPLSSLLPA